MNLLATKSAVLRVLLVDDEETPRDAMVTLLTAMGWEVEPCVSAIDALHRFESDEDEFDVILTDVQMPEIDGHELIARFRSGTRPCPPIVAYTGSIAGPQVDGADGFLTKPARASQICEAIENAIVSHRRPRQIGPSRRGRAGH